MAEAIIGAAMTYQGAASNTNTKPVQQVKDAEVQEIQTEKVIAVQTLDMTVKQGENTNSGSDENPAKKMQEKNEKIRKSVEEINKKLMKNTECQFGIHEETNRITIKIVDKDTKEVVREVPPEKTLEMIAKVWEFAGLLIDEKR